MLPRAAVGANGCVDALTGRMSSVLAEAAAPEFCMSKDFNVVRLCAEGDGALLIGAAFDELFQTLPAGSGDFGFGLRLPVLVAFDFS